MHRPANRSSRQCVCHFQDFLAAVPPEEKASFLREVDAEVISSAENPNRSYDRPEFGYREGYSSLVRDLRELFGRNAALTLYSLLQRQAGPGWTQRFSEGARPFLRELLEISEGREESIPYWGANPSNWYLVETDRSPFELESAVSSFLPCNVFENGRIEAAGSGVGSVEFTGLEDLISQIGLQYLWSRGNLGQAASIVVLDTGYHDVHGAGAVRADSIPRFTPVDEDGHGSAVVNLIREIAPQAQVRSIRVLQSHSNGEIWDLVNGLTMLHGNTDQIFTMALNINEPWVHALGPSAASFRESIGNILASLGNGRNFSICAAGNDGKERLGWPSASEEALSVGSHNAAMFRSSFSNYLANARNFVLAPGGDRRADDQRLESFGRYGRGLTRPVYGTSFSAAAASGVAALLQMYGWFRSMDSRSRVRLFRNHCRANPEGHAILNVPDVGAIWPL